MTFLRIAAVALAQIALLPALLWATQVVPIEPETPAPAAPAATISVHVLQKAGWFSKGPVAGLRIFLCREELREQIKAVRATGAILAEAQGPLRALSGDLTFMAARAAGSCLQQATTDDSGVCRFRNVPAGSYLIYAGRAQADRAGYWLVPMTVSGTDEVAVELGPDNLTESVKK